MLSIKPARPHDWPFIQSGLSRTRLNEGAVAASLNANFLVARKGGRFAGFAMLVLHKDIALFPALFVEPVFRGAGVGGHLLQRSITHVTARGARWLFTGCKSDGVALARRYGFEVERRELIPRDVVHRIEAASGADIVLMSMNVEANR